MPARLLPVGATLIRCKLLFGTAVASSLLLVGCQQSATSRLVGEWVGRPDTAAAAAARGDKLKAKQRSGTTAAVEAPSDEEAAAELGKTDLEQHDVIICMTLGSNKRVSMSLGDHSQPLEGVWRVVTTLPPDGAEIEISLTQSSEEMSERAEKRRFIIDFQENDNAPGFTLVEKGADPQFGRLYFVREDLGVEGQR